MATAVNQKLEMAGQPGQSNPLTKKLNKVLNIRLENDKDLLEALQALSGYFTENSLRTRRNLRGDIERRSIAINEEFARHFTEVKEQLDSVHEEVEAMSVCCAEMTGRLKAVKMQTSDLISQTSSLRAESAKMEAQSEIANAFLSRFLLTAEEVRVLRGTKAAGLEKGFFSALAKVKRIHSDCKSLLRIHHQTAGLDIMEAMALHQEAAYERLYRWAQSESRSLSGDSAEVSSLLCQAMLALEDRPVLFQYTMEEIATARRTAVVRCFIDALTRGGASGTPRPIELHAHDPLRYVGDMLAWLHQAVAMEKETLTVLLDKVDATMSSGAISLALCHIAEGICRPFKVRVEQVLVSQPGAVIVYQLSSLLFFYGRTIGTLLETPSTAILVTLTELRQLSQKMFFNSLNIHASKLLEKVEIPQAALSPPAGLGLSLNLLKSVLLSQDVTVIPLETRQEDFTRILSCLMDPLLQMCSLSASNLSKPAEMAVFLVNCIYQIQCTLAVFEFNDTRIEALGGQCEAHVDTLVHEQASHILSCVRLADIYNTIQSSPANRLVDLPGLDTNSMQAALALFDAYLANPEIHQLTECKLLLSSKIRESVYRRAADVVCEVYSAVFQAVQSEENGYAAAGLIITKTPEQIKTLLI